VGHWNVGADKMVDIPEHIIEMFDKYPNILEYGENNSDGTSCFYTKEMINDSRT
jgi:hypothetical protein